MKLVSKSLSFDHLSFQPIIRVCVEIPLEIMRDGIALCGEEEVKNILGTELFDLLKESKNE